MTYYNEDLYLLNDFEQDYMNNVKILLLLDSKSITLYGVIMEIYKSMKSEFNQLPFRVRLILIVH